MALSIRTSDIVTCVNINEIKCEYDVFLCPTLHENRSLHALTR